MSTMNSKEYADKIRETVEERERREDYEANLIAMGKDMPYQLEDAYKQGKVNAIKHVMDTYTQVKEHFKEHEGLTFEAFDMMLADAAEYIVEEL